MIFEKARIEDTGQLVKLRLAYLMEDMGKLNEKERSAIEQGLPDYFQRNLNHNIFCYVARKEQEIVACAFLLVVEKPMSPAFLTGKIGMVLNVYTKPECRHRGYAGKLMSLLLEDAIEKGLSTVELKATQSGYSLYKQMGFEDDITEYRLMKWVNGQ
ncbi:MAG: GNAT family N-acetyltransferase [Lachnospiraceae bacterium]|nr:GNAT family N-acetyltransferase [Lachnospiraceae bacterium]